MMDPLRATSEDIFDIELKRLVLSTRTRNCCERERIATVGQLSELTAANIIGWQNAGKKTLDEVRALLDALGLSLAGDPKSGHVMDIEILSEISSPVEEDSQPPISILLTVASRDVQKRLVSKLSDFPLSARASNFLAKSKLLYVGELAQLHYNDLISFQNIGRHTAMELTELVQKQGFELGMSIPDWSRQAAAKLEESFASERDVDTKDRSNALLAAVGPSPSSLEEELERIARALEGGRNAELLIKLWGWNGDKPRTLDSVGKELRLTRERIRQIESRALKKLKSFKFDTPYLKAAIAALRKRVPITGSNAKEMLRDGGFSCNEFSAASVKMAAELLGVTWSLAEIVLGTEPILVTPDDQAQLGNILSIVRRKTSEVGCLNIFSLVSEIEFDESRVDTIRIILDFIPGVEWLDESREWLYLRDSARNRLLNWLIPGSGVVARRWS
jgi:hypothetical protein